MKHVTATVRVHLYVTPELESDTAALEQAIRSEVSSTALDPTKPVVYSIDGEPVPEAE